MTSKRMTSVLGLLVLIGALLSGAARSEATLTFTLSTTFSGAPPSGSPTADITKIDADSVEIILEGNLLSSNEFIFEWYFNFADNPQDLFIESFSALNGQADQPTLSLSNLQADGDGVFNFKLVFEQGGGTAKRFDDDDRLRIVLTDKDGAISEADFNLQSVSGGGRGTFFSAAHVGGIASAPCVDDPTKSCTSGWVGDSGGGGGVTRVPAPTALILLGSGLLGITALRRRKK
jgi:hypothetical protein